MSVDRSNCVSFVVILHLVFSPCPSRPCSGPSLAASLDGLASVHLPCLDVNVFMYSSSACHRFHSSGGLSCVAEGLTCSRRGACFQGAALEGHPVLSVAPLVGTTKDDRGAPETN